MKILLSLLACLVMLPAMANAQNDADQANQARMADLPVTVWTTFDTYAVNEDLVVQGLVNYNPSYAFTIMVTSDDTNNILEIRQIELYGDSFEERFNTSEWGTGTYTVLAQNGPAHRSHSTTFQIVANIEPNVEPPTDEYPPGFIEGLFPNGQGEEIVELRPAGEEFTFPLDICVEEDLCINGDIQNGVMTDVVIEQESKSIEFLLEVEREGVLSLNIPAEILDGVHLITINGVPIQYTPSGTSYEIPIDEDTESVELVGTHVIPEFPIVMIILGIAMVSVVIVGSKTSLLPRI